MAASTLPLHAVPASAALRTGIALAATVAAFYTLCTLVWLAAPGPFLGFMNSLFHGIDFTLLARPGGFSWGGFFEALLVMSLGFPGRRLLRLAASAIGRMTHHAVDAKDCAGLHGVGGLLVSRFLMYVMVVVGIWDKFPYSHPKPCPQPKPALT